MERIVFPAEIKFDRAVIIKQLDDTYKRNIRIMIGISIGYVLFMTILMTFNGSFAANGLATISVYILFLIVFLLIAFVEHMQFGSLKKKVPSDFYITQNELHIDDWSVDRNDVRSIQMPNPNEWMFQTIGNFYQITITCAKGSRKQYCLGRNHAALETEAKSNEQNLIDPKYNMLYDTLDAWMNQFVM